MPIALAAASASTLCHRLTLSPPDSVFSLSLHTTTPTAQYVFSDCLHHAHLVCSSPCTVSSLSSYTTISTKQYVSSNFLHHIASVSCSLAHPAHLTRHVRSQLLDHAGPAPPFSPSWELKLLSNLSCSSSKTFISVCRKVLARNLILIYCKVDD